MIEVVKHNCDGGRNDEDVIKAQLQGIVKLLPCFLCRSEAAAWPPYGQSQQAARMNGCVRSCTAFKSSLRVGKVEQSAQ